MFRSPIGRTLPLAALAAVATLGCQAADLNSPSGPSFAILTGATARTHFEVCKEGSGATFSWTINGNPQTGFSLADGECQTIHSQAGAGTAASPDVVAVTEVSATSGYHLDHVDVTQYSYANSSDVNPGVASSTVAGPTASASVGLEKGATLTFYNVPDEIEGCTYTQGGYKNTLSRWPAGYSPSAMFFTSGSTWLEMFNTAPKKGNIYVKLAHQYMAAVMNVANGATANSSVQAAITGATNYFNGSSYSDSQLLAWHNLLDSFNNGNQGPLHCDD
jgi:hypothetical protein